MALATPPAPPLGPPAFLDKIVPRAEAAAHAARVGLLARVLAAFEGLQRPVRHCLGNHCLTNLPRATLNARLECAPAADAPSALGAATTPR